MKSTSTKNFYKEHSFGINASIIAIIVVIALVVGGILVHQKDIKDYDAANTAWITETIEQGRIIQGPLDAIPGHMYFCMDANSGYCMYSSKGEYILNDAGKPYNLYEENNIKTLEEKVEFLKTFHAKETYLSNYLGAIFAVVVLVGVAAFMLFLLSL